MLLGGVGILWEVGMLWRGRDLVGGVGMLLGSTGMVAVVVMQDSVWGGGRERYDVNEEVSMSQQGYR